MVTLITSVNTESPRSGSVRKFKMKGFRDCPSTMLVGDIETCSAGAELTVVIVAEPLVLTLNVPSLTEIASVSVLADPGTPPANWGVACRLRSAVVTAAGTPLVV